MKDFLESLFFLVTSIGGMIMILYAMPVPVESLPPSDKLLIFCGYVIIVLGSYLFGVWKGWERS